MESQQNKNIKTIVSLNKEDQKLSNTKSAIIVNTQVTGVCWAKDGVVSDVRDTSASEATAPYAFNLLEKSGIATQERHLINCVRGIIPGKRGYDYNKVYPVDIAPYIDSPYKESHYAADGSFPVYSDTDIQITYAAELPGVTQIDGIYVNLAAPFIQGVDSIQGNADIVEGDVLSESTYTFKYNGQPLQATMEEWGGVAYSQYAPGMSVWINFILDTPIIPQEGDILTIETTYRRAKYIITVPIVTAPSVQLKHQDTIYASAPYGTGKEESQQINFIQGTDYTEADSSHISDIVIKDFAKVFQDTSCDFITDYQGIYTNWEMSGDDLIIQLHTSPWGANYAFYLWHGQSTEDPNKEELLSVFLDDSDHAE